MFMSKSGNCIDNTSDFFGGKYLTILDIKLSFDEGGRISEGSGGRDEGERTSFASTTI